MYLFARSQSNPEVRKCFRIRSFKPWFWAKCGPDEAETHDIFNRPVRRVECDRSGDVPQLRKLYDYTCEADVPFALRFLIDRNIYCGFRVDGSQLEGCDDVGVPPRILFFDIEVESPNEILPRPEDPKWPIVSIQCADSYTRQIDVFVLDVPDWCEDITIEVETKSGKEVLRPRIHRFVKEETLLRAFAAHVELIDPDIITGWNSDLFDFPYLFRRAQRLGVDMSRLSPFRRAELRKRYGLEADAKTIRDMEVYIKGRDCIDFLAAYQKWVTGRQGVQTDRPFGLTWDLKYVVAYEAGFEYVDYGDQIETVHKHDPRTFIEYCIKDAFALLTLEEHTGVFTRFLDKLRRIVGCPISWALSNKKLIDTYALRISDRPLPTTQRSETEVDVKGAIVIEPPQGLHEYVACFDLKSLYPSLIVAWNISPETKDPQGEHYVKHHLRFKRHPEGIIPRIVRTLTEERERLRKLRKSLPEGSEEYKRVRQQETLVKFLACSVYGVTAYRNFRLFDPSCANAITYLGRKLLMKLKQTVEKSGYRVMYADTDSVFVKLRTRNPREAYVIESYLNDVLAKLAKEYGAKIAPEVKFERLFLRILFKPSLTKEGRVAKKRYAGYTSDGHLYIIGFEPRRSDSADVTRTVMRRFFELLLVENRFEDALKYVRDMYWNLHKLPLNEVAIPKGLRQRAYSVKNAWLRGVEYASEHLHIKFREDKKPRLLYIKRVRDYKLPSTDVICITEDMTELPHAFEIDWNKMREKCIGRKFRPIFEALGVNFDEYVRGQRQETLTRWFS